MESGLEKKKETFIVSIEGLHLHIASYLLSFDRAACSKC